MTETRRRYPAGTVTAQVRRPAAAGQPTVGFAHGLGAAPAMWQPLLDQMPPGCGLTTFGLPWDASGGDDWARQEEPTSWLDRALRLPERLPDVLVAHSFAATTALHLLSGPATLPAGLVLISPFYRESPAGVDWAVLTHYVNGFQGLLRDGLLARPGAGPDPALVDAMAHRLRDRISPYGWLRFFTNFAATPLLDLGGLTMPCLVIGGADDTASYPADCTALARALPRATVAITPGCGHFVMVDDPGRTANLLTTFLSDVVERATPGPGGQPLSKGAQP